MGMLRAGSVWNESPMFEVCRESSEHVRFEIWCYYKVSHHETSGSLVIYVSNKLGHYGSKQLCFFGYVVNGHLILYEEYGTITRSIMTGPVDFNDGICVTQAGSFRIETTILGVCRPWTEFSWRGVRRHNNVRRHGDSGPRW